MQALTLGVLQVLKESVVVPRHSALLVGLGVGIALHRSGRAANDSPQVGTLLVGTALLIRVALTREKRKRKKKKKKVKSQCTR